MVKRYALDFRRAEMFEIASGYYVTHDDYATLEAENAKLKAERDAHESLACDADDALKESEPENAKLRDLLRRVYACAENGSSAVDTTVRLALMLAEIKSAIEPSGDGGEKHPKDMLADIDQEELRP